jgi:hypothetical protein
METQKTQRRYPNVDWDYKAISIINDFDGIKRDIVYYTLINKDKRTEGVEIFSGANYVLGSNNRSYSKVYKFNKTPIKYKTIVDKLKKIHNETTWSNELYVNSN